MGYEHWTDEDRNVSLSEDVIHTEQSDQATIFASEDPKYCANDFWKRQKSLRYLKTAAKV